MGTQHLSPRPSSRYAWKPLFVRTLSHSCALTLACAPPCLVGQYFVSQGFSLKSEVNGSEQGSTITIKTTGAATLWALRYLTSRKCRALPLYDTAVIQHLLKKQLGLSSTVKLVDLSDVSVTTQIHISKE